MSTISDLASAGSSSAQNNAASQSISANYDLFMSMLTTQLQNQDPLDPLDSAQYTEQLVQYTQVEQQIQQNENLDQLLVQMKTQNASQFVGYIGNEVTALGDKAILVDDEAKWTYVAPQDGKAQIEIKNSEGAVVYREEVDIKEGDGTYKWEGTTESGSKAADGVYSISMTMQNELNQPFEVSTNITGVVTEVDFTQGEVVLRLGDLEVPVSDITKVKQV
ncbi:flagellar hook capping FlgD N-terminal domain-containing protein [Pseudovibrio exalbescens]|uniref:flagellar hook assembly protein FlgD n=1 Tax=Pseudovibrio exalbescens TaxID=197461 RepID=UPI002366BA18|nr:flagellar hook capping FlgD N-terminal domain-containing protein [Pseudovibrio exalbescens]MDD7910145.1 flagellar hook capping FlgD N-terminal domain-containing protein [Pseudovibrio exalbescens]